MPATDLYLRVGAAAGRALADLSPLVAGIEVDEDETRPSHCAVRLDDPFTVLADALREGIAVDVELGTVAEHCLVFRGRVHRVEEEFGVARAPALALHADDGRMRLGLRPRSRLWRDITLTRLIAMIGREHGFDPDIAANVSADVRYGNRGVRQQDETDLAFALRLAAENGCVLTLTPEPSRERLGLVAESRLGLDEPPVTLAVNGTGSQPLIRLRVRSDIAGVRLPVDLAGMDVDQARVTRATESGLRTAAPASTAGSSLATLHRESAEQATLVDDLMTPALSDERRLRTDLGATDTATTAPFATGQQLTDRIANRCSRFREGMRASGTTLGNPRLRPLTTVRLDGVGGRFSGVWLVCRTRHVVDAQGYRTEFDLRR